MDRMNICLTLVVMLASVKMSYQHGYLMDPPARSSAWLVDEDYYECCREYLHNQMFCGGKNHQWRVNDGKCSICGEAWDEPNKLWEKGGANYLGKVLRQYKTGSVMDVHVEISANHLGHFEFRICRVDGWEGDATQECLDQNVLYLANSTGENYQLNEDDHTVNLQIQLPDNFTCEHCVFQWKYVCGNDWGVYKDGNVVVSECVGCGKVQEHFFGCADIAIRDVLEITTRKVKSTTRRVWTEAPQSSCRRKLEFGTYLDFNMIGDVFCENICGIECPLLKEQTKQNLENGVANDPEDLITCLETCQKLCEC